MMFNIKSISAKSYILWWHFLCLLSTPPHPSTYQVLWISPLWSIFWNYPKIVIFWLFGHATLHPFQVAFESETMIRLLCFCILQPSRVKSLVTEMVVLSRSFDNIFGENIPLLRIDLLSYLTTRVHLCATYPFATNFSENILLHQIWFISIVFMLTICNNSRDIN